MKQILIIAVTMIAAVVVQATASPSYTDAQSKKSREAQERLYQLSHELAMIKEEIRLQREKDRRKEQYRQAAEEKNDVE